jgi:hypothetical protein
MANIIAKKSTVQPKSLRFDRPALCFFLFFCFFRISRRNILDSFPALMQIHRSKVPFSENISNPDRVQRILTGFNRPVHLFFFFLRKRNKKAGRNWIFNPTRNTEIIYDFAVVQIIYNVLKASCFSNFS